MICPKCAGKAYRTRSEGYFEDKILRLIRVRPFRCSQCRRRFYRYDGSATIRRREDGHRPRPVALTTAQDRRDFNQLLVSLRGSENRESGNKKFENKGEPGNRE
ncbi:MAG: hypothetical protein ACE15E_11415 [Acidobacteriota bacterium]